MTEQSKEKQFFTKKGNVLFLAIVCTLLWGSAIPCMKVGYDLFQIGADDLFGKFMFAGYRFSFAGILTLLFGWIYNKKFPRLTKKNAFPILGLGLQYTGLQYLFFYIGVANTTAVKSSILTAMGTFIAVILAHFFFKNDRITLQKAMGCIVGFAGVVLINLGGLDASFAWNGEGILIIAVFMFAIGQLISKKIAHLSDPVTITGYQLLAGGLMLVILGLCGGGRLNFTGLPSAGLLFYMSCLSAIAFTIWTFLLKHNPMGTVTIYNFFTPIFGVLLSAVILHESVFNARSMVALVLVCVGICLVNYQGKKKAQSQNQVQESQTN